MTMAVADAPDLIGHALPRIAPPTPLSTELEAFIQRAESMGITLMPWQETAGRYLTATNPDGLRLYREVCIVVARQNGKTTLLKPLIVEALYQGKKVLHIAQNRELPRVMFPLIASALPEDMFPKRRGKGGRMQTVWPRYGAGQEEILLANGGSYRIAAASTGAARGYATDLVVIDELLEMQTWDVISAAEPTLTMSADPQLIYLSNAGDATSVVLNSVRERAGQDEHLAYLEWSAHPDREPDDREGWAESNPALGHFPSVQTTLESGYTKHRLAGTLSIYRTEHLCQWVEMMREPLVAEADWSKCQGDVGEVVRPFMGVALDPAGTRASAAMAWATDSGIKLRMLYDVTGSPIDATRLGRDMRDTARQNKVSRTGFSPLSDALLAKHLGRTEPLSGQKWANATARFVELIEGGRLTWEDCAAVGADLTWTARKRHDESGSFEAVRGNDERPITAVLAAIRAVWLASEPRPSTERSARSAMGF